MTLLNEQGSDKGIELLHGASRNLRPPTLRLARTPRHARSNCAQLALPAESIRLGRIDAGRRDRGSRVLLHGGSSATVHFASFCPDDRHCSKVRRHAGVPHLRSCPGRRREHLRRHPPSPPHAPPAPRRSTRRLKRRPLVAPPRVTFPNAGPHSGYYDRDGLCALFHPRPKRCASTRSACFDARARLLDLADGLADRRSGYRTCLKKA